MTETAAAPDNAALHAQEQLSCLPSCCAKLELGSLFCSHCRVSGLIRLATEGLESELSELPALFSN
jgi:hypothetical protein